MKELSAFTIASLAQNNPGQSGDPNNKHYKDLFENWAKTLRSNQEINKPILLLKNPKKTQTKSVFENLIPKTWTKRTAAGSPPEETYNPKE